MKKLRRGITNLFITNENEANTATSTTTTKDINIKNNNEQHKSFNIQPQNKKLLTRSPSFIDKSILNKNTETPKPKRKIVRTMTTAILSVGKKKDNSSKKIPSDGVDIQVKSPNDSDELNVQKTTATWIHPVRHTNTLVGSNPRPSSMTSRPINTEYSTKSQKTNSLDRKSQSTHTQLLDTLNRIDRMLSPSNSNINGNLPIIPLPDSLDRSKVFDQTILEIISSMGISSPVGSLFLYPNHRNENLHRISIDGNIPSLPQDLSSAPSQEEILNYLHIIENFLNQNSVCTSTTTNTTQTLSHSQTISTSDSSRCTTTTTQCKTIIKEQNNTLLQSGTFGIQQRTSPPSNNNNF